MSAETPKLGVRMFILGGGARLTVTDSQETVGTPFADIGLQKKIAQELITQNGAPFVLFDLDHYAKVLEAINKRDLPIPPERIAEQRKRDVELAIALSGLLDVARTSF